MKGHELHALMLVASPAPIFFNLAGLGFGVVHVGLALQNVSVRYRGKNGPIYTPREISGPFCR
jgi:hypothetical protein